MLAGASPRWFSVRGTLECVHVLATARWLGKERKKEAERKKNAEDRPEADFPVIYNLMTEGPQHCAPCHQPYRPTWLNGPGDQAEDARGRRGPGGISASQGIISPAQTVDGQGGQGTGERIKALRCAFVKVTESCPTFCDPKDYTVQGILQARKPEWVAFPFSRGIVCGRLQRRRSHLSHKWIPGSSKNKDMESRLWPNYKPLIHSFLAMPKAVRWP